MGRDRSRRPLPPRGVRRRRLPGRHAVSTRYEYVAATAAVEYVNDEELTSRTRTVNSSSCSGTTRRSCSTGPTRNSSTSPTECEPRSTRRGTPEPESRPSRADRTRGQPGSPLSTTRVTPPRCRASSQRCEPTPAASPRSRASPPRSPSGLAAQQPLAAAARDPRPGRDHRRPVNR